MRLLAGLALALWLGSPAFAGKVDTVEQMVKQAQKLGGSGL